MEAAAKIVSRLDALGAVSEAAGCLTRRYATPALRQARDLTQRWMEVAGMVARVDAVGNLIGHYAGAAADAKILMLGSHLDSVPNAGKYDGPLGIILALACVEQLAGRRLPFAIEVIAFADEEGSRFQTSYLGSGVVAGAITEITRPELRQAMREFGGDPDALVTCQIPPGKLLGYAEAHIEQGPILEQKNLAVGVVTAIAGQSRADLIFEGRAGHAGTTPMRMRQDALCAASEFVLEVQRYARRKKGLVATVGKMTVEPGASNVIPGRVALTLDVRHQDDAVRLAAVQHFQKCAAQWTTVGDTPTVQCDGAHVARLRQAVRRQRMRVLEMVSGAGHDAAMMARIAPVAMLFVRCKNGVSHHPAEAVAEEDLRVALAAFSDYVHEFV